jgi:hypothetical protein
MAPYCRLECNVKYLPLQYPPLPNFIVGSTRSWPLFVTHELAAFIFKVDRHRLFLRRLRHPLSWPGSEAFSTRLVKQKRVLC